MTFLYVAKNMQPTNSTSSGWKKKARPTGELCTLAEPVDWGVAGWGQQPPHGGKELEERMYTNESSMMATQHTKQRMNQKIPCLCTTYVLCKPTQNLGRLILWGGYYICIIYIYIDIYLFIDLFI